MSATALICMAVAGMQLISGTPSCGTDAAECLGDEIVALQVARAPAPAPLNPRELKKCKTDCLKSPSMCVYTNGSQCAAKMMSAGGTMICPAGTKDCTQPGGASAPAPPPQTPPLSPPPPPPSPPSPPSSPSPPPLAQPGICTATPAADACDFQPGAGISSWFTEKLFNQMFPNICNSKCHGCKMLTYKCLIKATLMYPDFAQSSSMADNKRELAAWLGEMSQETTGGGCGKSRELSDGSCSCGSMWCDGDSGGCSSWGLCFVEEVGGTYCSPNSVYPCKSGREYKGRGPKQLSWNYNYGQFSEQFCGNKSLLLDNPGWVATNPTLAWASSIWFWFTGGACLPQTGEICKPGCHEAFLGTKTMCPRDVSAGRRYGLGWVTNIINGGLECGGAGKGKCDYRVHSRVRFYKHFSSILGVSPLAAGWTEDDNLFCHNQKNYETFSPQQC